MRVILKIEEGPGCTNIFFGWPLRFRFQSIDKFKVKVGVGRCALCAVERLVLVVVVVVDC